MAVLRIDPPPASNDPAVLRSYIADLYEALTGVLYSLDTDNMSEDFLKNIGNSKEDSNDGL